MGAYCSIPCSTIQENTTDALTSTVLQTVPTHTNCVAGCTYEHPAVATAGCHVGHCSTWAAATTHGRLLTAAASTPRGWAHGCACLSRLWHPPTGRVGASCQGWATSPGNRPARADAPAGKPGLSPCRPPTTGLLLLLLLLRGLPLLLADSSGWDGRRRAVCHIRHLKRHGAP
jgi:hypothetical protein